MLSGGWLLPLQASAASHPQQLKPYTALYQVSRGSFIIGQATIRLTIDSKNQYHFKGYTKPVGLAAVFRNDEITEVSQGIIENTAVKPSTYRYRHKKRKKTRQVDLQFNWNNKSVRNETEGSRWNMQIPAHTQDKFSQQLALMINLNLGKPLSKFQVADGGRLKNYSFKVEKQAKLKVEAGEFQAIKVNRQKGTRPSRAVFWMAPELNHIPIKVVKKEGDGKFSMELVKITWTTHKHPE